MAKAKKSRPKKRANKYNERLKANASFDELMGALFPKPEEKMLPPKKAAKKKTATKKNL